jgi:hypothetical protein
VGSRRRLDRLQELVGEREYLLSDEGTIERVSEGMLGIVALELTLSCARWVVANRDGAADLLPDVLGDREKQLDAVWHAVAVRRDAIVHTEGWRAFRGMDAGVTVGPRSIEIAGFPPLDLASWRMWTTILRDWSEQIASDPMADDGRPFTKPRPVKWGDDPPDWLVSKRR